MKTLIENEMCIAKGMLDGDRNSYIEFVEKFSPMIYRECLNACFDADEADDHLNEILIRVVMTIGRFDADRGSMYAWVITITKNYFKNYYFKKQRDLDIIYCDADALDLYENNSSMDILPDNIQDEEPVQDSPAISLLKKALASISGRDRSILFYRADGFSFESIADFLRMKSGTAMTAYSRAVKKIKTMFEQEAMV